MNFYSVAPLIKEYYPEYYSVETYPAKDCVKIHKVSEEWGVFCNFARTPISFEGRTFKTSEQLFQLMKFKDEEVVKAVYAANNPKMTAKHWEKTHRRADWGQMIVDAMKFCLQMKYQQSQAFRDALEESKGRYIVEDQTTFRKLQPDTWGVKPVGDDFVGPNLLGRLLMELRDNGKLEYKLPDDAFVFMDFIKKDERSQEGCSLCGRL